MKHVVTPLFAVLATWALAAYPAAARQTLVAVPVVAPPVIDGSDDDKAWAMAEAVVTRDEVAEIDVTLKAVRSRDELFILASFPDATENREHKTLHWNPSIGVYEEGPEREDTFVLKWNMEPLPVSLKLSADAPYKADVWFWKALRTDPSGYADDKMQVYSFSRSKAAKWMLSSSGRNFYLTRSGDAGTSAYDAAIYPDYAGDTVPAFVSQRPSGSRADIQAKGVWRDGRWTIEFRRKLDTGHPDDIRFALDQTYQFGISRYEIAGRDADPRLEQPLYGFGEVGEELILRFR